jgi:hypothetical protein
MVTGSGETVKPDLVPIVAMLALWGIWFSKFGKTVFHFG